MNERASLTDLTNDGTTAFIFAAKNGQLATVRFLLDGGADICDRSDAGRTALILAARTGKLEIVGLL